MKIHLIMLVVTKNSGNYASANHRIMKVGKDL